MTTSNNNPQVIVKKLTEKAQRYCAYTERCHCDVRQKLLSLGADENTICSITARLQKEGYLDDARFAQLFANGKFRSNRWGKTKIRAELIKRQIPESLIRKALENINEEAYRQSLSLLINKKIKELSDKQACKISEKVTAYCLRKGFEPDIVWEMLNKNDQL